jgi:hypothetical protein
MKTAIYIADGVTQLVLTPETDYERSVLDTLGNGEQRAKMFKGSFYECSGGWVRQTSSFSSDYSGYNRERDSSLIVRVDRESPVSSEHPSHD